jgi:hypothetical protein
LRLKEGGIVKEESEEVVGKAIPGKGPNNQHSHDVVLVGEFKKEEKREPEHKKDKRPERKERERDY